MSNEDKDNGLKECFGSQGRQMLYGEMPKECISCTELEICHKISIVSSLQAIADGMDLIIQNGLSNGMLKGFGELEEEYETEEKRKN